MASAQYMQPDMFEPETDSETKKEENKPRSVRRNSQLMSWVNSIGQFYPLFLALLSSSKITMILATALK